MIAATSLGPSVYWYATRGSGYAALVLLTASAVLGVLTSVRWSAPEWPRFMSQAVHRNVSLLVLFFLVIHIATSIIDPFAGLTIRDAVVPVGAGYRPLWLGLGVVGTELLVAIAATSLLRSRIPFRWWRVVHLLSYAAWPVAVLHALGTGSDTKAVWAILLVLACVAAVAGAVAWRLEHGWPRWAVLRMAGFAVCAAGVVALAVWTASGPLQPGWAAAAGTPANLLTGTGSGTSTPAPSLPAGLDDSLQGSVTRSQHSATATLQDTRDTAVRVVIIANDDGSGSLEVIDSGATLCNTNAAVAQDVTASCGTLTVTVTNINVDPSGNVTATLETR